MEISGRKGFKVEGELCAQTVQEYLKGEPCGFRGENSHPPKHTHPLTFNGEWKGKYSNTVERDIQGTQVEPRMDRVKIEEETFVPSFHS